MKFPRLLLASLALAFAILSWRTTGLGTAKANNVAQNTINAATCNLADVQRALTQAHDGDTVVLPPGTCTWTSTLTMSQATNLLGSSQGNTTIVDSVGRQRCSDNPALFINVSANLPWRLANLTIQGSSADPGQCSEHIKILTNSHSFRVDHLTFSNMSSTGIRIDGDAWGLIDHSTFNGDHKRGVLVFHTSWGQVGAWGDNSWAQPDSLGTNQAVFIEDSTFNITNAIGSGAVACQNGARCVVRHNTLPYLGTHGTDSTRRMRSVRQFEAYNNTITDNGSTVSQAMQLRGGTLLFFNNTMNPTRPGSYKAVAVVALETYREADGWAPYGLPSDGYRGSCSGTSPFDNNDGKSYDNGIHNGSSGSHDTLIDSTKNWTPNKWVGYSLYNATATWGASIQSNTTTTITTYPSAYGQSHTWNAGDAYQILHVYPCLDQPGRGMGAYLSGGTSGLPPTPTGWPSQAPDPIYAWNNSVSGALSSVLKGIYTHVQANRDYFDWTSSFDGTSGVGQGLLSARPSTCTPLVGYWATDKNTLYQCSAKNTWTTHYTPYTYPHPLQGTSVPPPTKTQVTGIH